MAGADADVLIRAKILYYGRERYYHQMQVQQFRQQKITSYLEITRVEIFTSVLIVYKKYVSVLLPILDCSG